MARAASTNDLLTATDGATPLGPKGRRTRQRIMEATAELLKDRAFGDIRITEIARMAGVTQPNFYTYFRGTEEVVLALAESFLEKPDQLSDVFLEDWSGANGVEQARRLVHSAIQIVGDARPLLGWINLLADKMHGDFPAMRARIWRTLYKAFEGEVRKAQAAGRISRAVQPRLAGYECVGLVLSVSVRYELLRDSGFSHAQLVNTTAALLHSMATGLTPTDEAKTPRKR
jgi:AcrR family transcriptional regulator